MRALRTPPHLNALPAGITQTRYSKFKTAPENRVRTVFDRATERLRSVQEGWKKTPFWEGDIND